MKNIILLLIILLFTNLSYAQEATQLQISDTRFINEAPGDFKQITRFDFKAKSTVGLLAGNGTYSTMLTVAPWIDPTGNYNHQINFNNDGLFYRTGVHGSSTWNQWQKIVLANQEGRIEINTGAAGLSLKSADQDHVYMQFYARSNTPDIRSAWFGYGTTGSSKLQLTNEIAGGSIVLMTNNGNVGIDTTTPAEKLSVNGNIRAKEIKVEATNWPDYVFKDDYSLLPLSTVKSYIDKHQHLPEIPSEQQIAKEGLNLGEMNKLLLKKIEELTLYLIDKDQENKSLNERVNSQQKEMKELQQQVKIIADRLSVKND